MSEVRKLKYIRNLILNFILNLTSTTQNKKINYKLKREKNNE